MKKVFLSFLTIGFLTLLSSCDNSNEKVVKEVSKANSVEITYSTKDLSNMTLLTETMHCYVNGKEIKSVVRVDTLPLLNMKVEQFTIEGEESDSIAYKPVRKKYEFFVTIK